MKKKILLAISAIGFGFGIATNAVAFGVPQPEYCKMFPQDCYCWEQLGQIYCIIK